MMKTAMILAAGRGERLKPLTDQQPKALCRVHNLPLIEHHIINLTRAGFQRVIINHAHLGGQIRQHLGNGSRWGVSIQYAAEPPGGLETGGGIVNALPLLGNEPFVTVNADIYTDFDFKQLSQKLVPYIHLVLVHKNSELAHHGDFSLVNGIELSNDAPLAYTFSGIACYNPAIFAHCQQGRYSITPQIRHYAAEKKASAQIHQGKWFDIGTMERLAAANHHL